MELQDEGPFVSTWSSPGATLPHCEWCACKQSPRQGRVAHCPRTPLRRSSHQLGLVDGGSQEDSCSVLRYLKVSPFHLFSIASFAPISFAIKAKENDLLPLEKNRVKLDDDSDDDEENKEGQESASTAANTDPVVAPPCVVVEEKRPQLTQEELEAKQGWSGHVTLGG